MMVPFGTKIFFVWFSVAVSQHVVAVTASKATVYGASASSCASAKGDRAPKKGISMLQAAYGSKDKRSLTLSQTTIGLDDAATDREAPRQDERHHRGKRTSRSKQARVAAVSDGAPLTFFQLDATSSSESSGSEGRNESNAAGAAAVGSPIEILSQPPHREGWLAPSVASAPPLDFAPGEMSSGSHTGAMGAALFASAVLMFFLVDWWRNPGVATSVRWRAAGMRVTTGVELQSMFGMLGKDHNVAVAKPLSPGILMRIQGRVVAREPGDVLCAPLSSRPCVIYSASVSHHRNDGVHQPPLAFHSSGVDFAVQLLDAPHLSVGVHHHDAALFDMNNGRYASENTFAEACEQWRSFAWAHLTAGADVSQSVTNRTGAGFDGKLEFRECALVLGASITIVGEVAQNRDGGLSLYPWQPPLPLEIARAPWITTPSKWLSPCPERRLVPKLGEPERDPMVGRVMASDDPALLTAQSQCAFLMAAAPLPSPGRFLRSTIMRCPCRRGTMPATDADSFLDT